MADPLLFQVKFLFIIKAGEKNIIEHCDICAHPTSFDVKYCNFDMVMCHVFDFFFESGNYLKIKAPLNQST